MSNKISKPYKRALSLIEVVLAIALFGIFSAGVGGLITQGFKINQRSVEQTTANAYASEGIEAIRSIRNQSFSLLNNTASTGVLNTSGTWVLSGANNIFDKYTRTVAISDVQRDTSGNIVSSGGTVDNLTKAITVTVNWTSSGNKALSTSLSTYLTSWDSAIPPSSSNKGGMLVYNAGGQTSDLMRFRILDRDTGVWSTPTDIPDIDPNTNNRYPVLIRVYSSPTRNEKIVVSKHRDWTNDFFYAQVWNGSSFSNKLFLGQAPTVEGYEETHNFDGTYLQNGDFMVGFGDSTNAPKFNVWNGNAWLPSNISMQNAIAPAAYLVLKCRPGTNEVMVAIYDRSHNVVTEYFNGQSYSAASWGSPVQHITKATNTLHRLIDFAWNQKTPTKGALIYVGNSSNRSLAIKIWTANGSGSGSFSAAVDSTAMSHEINAVQVETAADNDAFIACAKDLSSTQPRLRCLRSDLTPIWSYSTNNQLSPATDIDDEQSFALAIGKGNPVQYLNFFGDSVGSNFPLRYKTYNFVTNSWDLNATLVNVSPFTISRVSSVKAIPKPNSNDAMVILIDEDPRLFSFVWDSSNNRPYTNPSGWSINLQGTNIAGEDDFWFDFAWDN